MGLLLPPPKNATLSEHPHLFSSHLCQDTVSVWETAADFEWNQTRCSQQRWSDITVSPAVLAPGGQSLGHQNTQLCQSPQCRWPTLKSRPSTVVWEMLISQICCHQQKTKPLTSHVAGNKKEWDQEWPRGGPSGTMAILSRTGNRTQYKGTRCPQTPAAASAQNRGVQIWFLSSKSSYALQMQRAGSHAGVHAPIPLPSMHAALTARRQFIWLYRNEVLSVVEAEWGNRQWRGMGVSASATVPALGCFAWKSQNFSCSGQPDEQHKSLVSQVFTVFFLFPFSHGLCGQQHKIPRHSHLNTSFLFMLSVAFMFSC